jgi:hypothetical protein
LRHIDEAVHIGRGNDVADIDLPDAGHPVDGGREIGVPEIHARTLDDRLVRLYDCDVLIDDGLLRLGFLLSDRVLLG